MPRLLNAKFKDLKLEVEILHQVKHMLAGYIAQMNLASNSSYCGFSKACRYS